MTYINIIISCPPFSFAVRQFGRFCRIICHGLYGISNTKTGAFSPIREQPAFKGVVDADDTGVIGTRIAGSSRRDTVVGGGTAR